MEVDGPYMTVFTGSMSLWCCRRKECIKAITPVSDPLPSLSLLAIVVALLWVNLYPKHFSATSINASVNSDLNWSTSTSSSSWKSLLSPSWTGHPKGMLVYGNARAWPFSFFFFFRWKKVWQDRPRLFTVLYFSVRSSRSSTLRVMGCHLAWVSKLLRGLEL